MPAAIVTGHLAFCGASVLLIGALLTGCATPGPMHAYVAATAAPGQVVDLGASPPRPGDSRVETFPTFARPDQALLGLGYEPFTDHFYLRLPPGNRIRVVDRPGRRIKREFTIADLPPGGGDLALRPRDRHVFLLHPTQPVVIETTEIGERRRTLRIAGLESPPVGIAFDPVEQRLHLLVPGTPAAIVTVDLNGMVLSRRSLARPVAPRGLAFDADARLYYVLLPDQRTFGRFTLDGQLHDTLPTGRPNTVDYFDVGPRSLVRVF